MSPWDDDLKDETSVLYRNYETELTTFMSDLLQPILTEFDLDVAIMLSFSPKPSTQRIRRSTEKLLVKYKLVFWLLSSDARSFASLADVGSSVSGKVSLL